MVAEALHRAPRPISTGRAKRPRPAARVGHRETVRRRTAPVWRSAMTKVYRRACMETRKSSVEPRNSSTPLGLPASKKGLDRTVHRSRFGFAAGARRKNRVPGGCETTKALRDWARYER